MTCLLSNIPLLYYILSIILHYTFLFLFCSRAALRLPFFLAVILGPPLRCPQPVLASCGALSLLVAEPPPNRCGGGAPRPAKYSLMEGFGFDDDDAVTLVSGRFDAPGGPPVAGAPAQVEADESLGAAAPSTAGSAGKTRKGAASRAGEKSCPGCARSLPLSEFPPNSKFCHSDKKALDVMGKLAKREGEEADKFLSQSRRTDKNIKVLLRNYYAATGGAGGGAPGKRAACTVSNFSIAQTMESISASRALDVVEEAELMTKKDYLGFMHSRGQGMEDACKAWKDMEDDMSCVKATQNGQLYIRVVTGLKMNRRETLELKKEVQGFSKQFKKPSGAYSSVCLSRGGVYVLACVCLCLCACACVCVARLFQFSDLSLVRNLRLLTCLCEFPGRGCVCILVLVMDTGHQ